MKKAIRSGMKTVLQVEKCRFPGLSLTPLFSLSLLVLCTSLSANAACELKPFSDTQAASADGRFVVFDSSEPGLVVSDNNNAADIFIYDHQNQTTQRVSVSSEGFEGESSSHSAAVSSNGQMIAFVSNSSHLVSDDTNGKADIFLHDRLSGNTTRISKNSFGIESNGENCNPRLSLDARYVVFESDANNLVEDDTNAVADWFMHDSVTGTTRIPSEDPAVENGVIAGDVSLQKSPRVSVETPQVNVETPQIDPSSVSVETPTVNTEPDEEEVVDPEEEIKSGRGSTGWLALLFLGLLGRFRVR